MLTTYNGIAEIIRFSIYANMYTGIDVTHKLKKCEKQFK